MVIRLTGIDYQLAPWGALNLDPPHLVKRLRYALLVSSIVMLTGKKVNGAFLCYALELKSRDAAYNPKDKQHAGYALEVLNDVSRIVVAMDADETLPDPPARVVLDDL